MLYHASPTGGLTVLTPHVSNHGHPLVYFSKKRENVLVYLSNAVEKYCRDTGFVHTGRWEKWGPYGFDLDGVQRLEEYYPNALVETYAKTCGFWADDLIHAQYGRTLHFDLSSVTRTLAGPSNPHRRLPV